MKLWTRLRCLFHRRVCSQPFHKAVSFDPATDILARTSSLQLVSHLDNGLDRRGQFAAKIG
jgi:hypothetical protein